MKFLILVLLLYNIEMVVTKNKKWKIHLPNKIKVFNLGSSHGYFAFNYNKINGGGNLAYESQTFYYDFKMLMNFWENIEENSICFLPVSYFSFSERKFWISEDKNKYFKILRFSLIDKEDKLETFIMRYLPLLYSIIKRIKKVKKKIKKTVVERIKGHIKICKNSNEEVSLAYLEQIIKKLKEKNIRIILITTPFRKYYNNFFTDELLNEKFYKYINQIKNKYNLEYYDFSHSYEVFENEEYFNDYDHLSEKGSEIFMKEIEKIIKKKV